MDNLKFVEKLKNALTYNTVYALGMFGQPITPAIILQKARQLPRWYTQARIQKLMKLAKKGDYFGFDCVCLIKAILWGWNANLKHTNGGAVYMSNGVPDKNEEQFIRLCKDVSTNFKKIEIGEYLWMNGHCGIYIGDGLAVECTPIWNGNVQITAVKNIGDKAGYNPRLWTKHGKLPYIEYRKPVKNPGEIVENVKKSVDEIAREVINGGWGNGSERKKRLTAAGYSYLEVQKRVNEICAGQDKSVDEIAREVINGAWGNGAERRKRLTAAGYSYSKIQKRVNEILK